MDQKNSGQMTSEPLLAAWIKWTMDFWETMAQMGPGLAGAGRSGGQASRETAGPAGSLAGVLELMAGFFFAADGTGNRNRSFSGYPGPLEDHFADGPGRVGRLFLSPPTVAGGLAGGWLPFRGKRL